MNQAQKNRAVQLLSLYIELMEQLVDDLPIRELFLAQEDLRLCLGTYGTKYFANTHLTLKGNTATSSTQEKPKLKSLFIVMPLIPALTLQILNGIVIVSSFFIDPVCPKCPTPVGI